VGGFSGDSSEGFSGGFSVTEVVVSSVFVLGCVSSSMGGEEEEGEAILGA
jgi:hypothetical protein